MLKGKKLSILGDSISTYKGVSNDKSINSTIGGNAWFYTNPFPLEKTYWSLLLDRLGMTLCVNNSWSGGNLHGVDDPTSGVNMAQNLAKDNGELPDLIIVFMGINDLGRDVRCTNSGVFGDDYARTLNVIKESYPAAKVCCVNIPDLDVSRKAQGIIYNGAIEAAVEMAGDNFFIADLFTSRLNNDFYYNNTVDGLHPDEDGMRIIADIIEIAIQNNLN